jgi:Periplasmic binding protein
MTVIQNEIETARVHTFPPQKKSASGFALRPLKIVLQSSRGAGCTARLKGLNIELILSARLDGFDSLADPEIVGALMKIGPVFRVIVCGLVLAFVGRARGDQSAQLHSQRAFKVGVLATLTGSGFSLGKDTVAALQIAEEQIEANAISQHGGYRFHFFVRDTQHDPSKALEAIKDLDKRGVQIIIGPQTSSEVRMIKPYADAHNILVISQGSTASSLSIAGLTLTHEPN